MITKAQRQHYKHYQQYIEQLWKVWRKPWRFNSLLVIILCFLVGWVWIRSRYGVIYSIGNTVDIRKENFELQFSEKKFIPCENKRCVLLVKKLQTVGFNSHLHAYRVKILIAATSFCLDFTELFDYHPLDNSISDENALVRLKYHKISHPPSH